MTQEAWFGRGQPKGIKRATRNENERARLARLAPSLEDPSKRFESAKDHALFRASLQTMSKLEVELDQFPPCHRRPASSLAKHFLSIDRRKAAPRPRDSRYVRSVPSGRPTSHPD